MMFMCYFFLLSFVTFQTLSKKVHNFKNSNEEIERKLLVYFTEFADLTGLNYLQYLVHFWYA